MVTSRGNKRVVWRKRQCKEQCQVHAGEKDHVRPRWTTSRCGKDSLLKSQSEWQGTEINGESTSMVWPTLRSRMAKEQNRTVLPICCYATTYHWQQLRWRRCWTWHRQTVRRCPSINHTATTRHCLSAKLDQQWNAGWLSEYCTAGESVK